VEPTTLIVCVNQTSIQTERFYTMANEPIQLLRKANQAADPPDANMADDTPNETETITPAKAVTSIPKPPAFSLDGFASDEDDMAAGVETLQTGLPHHSISQAKDFCRLHPDEKEYWSPELWFVNVPVKGQKRDTLHLIQKDVAQRNIDEGKIMRFRLALAAKPFDVFFLAHVPTRNQDNEWNRTNLEACEQAKTLWVQATSRKEENVEGYKIGFAKDPDAFPPPKWPRQQSLTDLIHKTFVGRIIDRDDHPALARIVGFKPPMS
jgi:hypothetical protein